MISAERILTVLAEVWADQYQQEITKLTITGGNNEKESANNLDSVSSF